MTALLDDLRASFRGRLLTEGDAAPFLVDWRKMWHGRALGVAQPDSTQDVAAIVRWCVAHSVPIVPQGGNTGLSGGATPDETGTALVLSLTRMRTVRAIDERNNTMTVDAGCVLGDVQAAAGGVDRLFPLSLAAEGSCTIGGNLATNAGGTAVLRYGNMRELCLGLEVVTASGDVWNGLAGLRKDNTGYDLRDLFIGSEGTLGVITGAVLKLFPKPTQRRVALLAVSSVDDALAVFDDARRNLSLSLSACELFSDLAMSYVERHSDTMRSPLASRSPWYVLIEVSAAEFGVHAQFESCIASWIERSMVSDAVISGSEAQFERFWAFRENISEAQGSACPSIKHDVAVPISQVASFIASATSELARVFPQVRPLPFGHLGDGNIHYNVLPEDDHADTAAFLAETRRINHLVHDIVRQYDGSISAEHGLGVLRRDEALRFRDPVATALQRSIKRALDPNNIMNPGKVLTS